MKAVYIVNNSKVAKTLIDPMRRAILDLLRQKPMTQAQMADELGLSSASLNYHIKILRSRKLVVVAKREYERHGIKQIFFLAAAYLFVYDLDLLPKSIARYFCPVSLERARSTISLLIMNNRNNSIDQTPFMRLDHCEICGAPLHFFPLFLRQVGMIGQYSSITRTQQIH